MSVGAFSAAIAAASSPKRSVWSTPCTGRRTTEDRALLPSLLRQWDVDVDDARREFDKWAEANKRPRTVRTYKQCLDALAKSFAGRRLGAISAFDVERHKRSRLEAGVRVMVNRELACLRALYNRCRDWGKYEGDNPVVKVRPVKESAGRRDISRPRKSTRSWRLRACRSTR
jgi:hypothetical protein